MRFQWAMFAAALCAPSAAAACGGLFCNSAAPVEQTAERIVFAPDGPTMHMHVQIQYAGPPAEFGWLLPAPADVQAGLSSNSLFTALDRSFTPEFRRVVQQDWDACEQYWGDEGSGGAGGDSFAAPDAAVAEPDVQVLARGALGPYEQATLRADSVDDLLRWLDDNGYNPPAG